MCVCVVHHEWGKIRCIKKQTSCADRFDVGSRRSVCDVIIILLNGSLDDFCPPPS